MGTLVIRRPSDWFGRYRRLKVYIDGSKVAGLRSHQSFTAEVAEGRHEVRGQMDWLTCPALAVEVHAGEVVTVELSLPVWRTFKAFLLPRRAVTVRQL